MIEFVYSSTYHEEVVFNTHDRAWRVIARATIKVGNESHEHWEEFHIPEHMGLEEIRRQTRAWLADLEHKYSNK